MSDALSQFAQSILALCLPVLAAYLARELKALLRRAAGRLEAQESAEVRDLLSRAASIAVRAAEQMGGDGAAKLTMAQEIAQKYLDTHGVQIDVGLLRGLVEAQVQQEFGKPPTNPKPSLFWNGQTMTIPAGTLMQDTAAPTGREIE